MRLNSLYSDHFTVISDENDGGSENRLTRSKGRQKGKDQRSISEYLEILNYTVAGIESLHFAFTHSRFGRVIYINDIKFNISYWNETYFMLFLEQIKKKNIGRVTFNPVPPSIILQVLKNLPDGIIELSFGCCFMDAALMTGITEYLNKNTKKEKLETFQIWDATGIEFNGMVNLLTSLSHGYNNLKVLQLITDSGMSPLHKSFQSILASLLRNLPLLEDLILNSQEVGDPKCAIEVIHALSTHNHVKVLDISLNTVADEILEHIGSFLSTNTTLQRLYLWGNYFVEDGIKHLVEPLSKHHHLDRIHIECVPKRFSLENCKQLARIIESNKSLTEIDGVDYNDEFFIDLEHAKILLQACRTNTTLSRVDFFLQEDHYPILSSAPINFSCKSDGYFSHNLLEVQEELDLASAHLLIISRLSQLLDLPYEIVDIIVRVSVPPQLAPDLKLLVYILRDPIYFGKVSSRLPDGKDKFTFQNLIRSCHALRCDRLN